MVDNSVRKEGFTTLSTGTPVVDIVFVHGLQGHPRDTWTFTESDPDTTSGSGGSRLSFFGGLRKKSSPRSRSPRADSDAFAPKTSIFWPRDLLANDFPQARILTYGYDSHVSQFFGGSASQSTISGLGRDLLYDLEFQRRSAPNRPLIFLVHSLGGLVLKETLLRSKWHASEDHEDVRAIFRSTFGVCFFGTPHRGSSYAGWGMIAANIVRAMGLDANDSLVRNLQVQSEKLEDLREGFSQMLAERSFHVYTFQEARGFHGIVDDASSALDDAREQKQSIQANHVNMCRFTGPHDNGYTKVKAAIDWLIRLIEGAPPVAPPSPLPVRTTDEPRGQASTATQQELEAALTQLKELKLEKGVKDLLKAAHEGNVAEVRSLLDLGVDVNTEFTEGYTALHAAAVKGHLQVVQLLLERRASLIVGTLFVPHDHASALQWTCGPAGSGSLPIIKLILEHSLTEQGPERTKQLVNRKSNPFGWTCLRDATAANRPAVAQALLNYGAVLLSDDKGRTPLHHAAGSGYIDMLDTLLRPSSPHHAAEIQYFLHSREDNRLHSPLRVASDSGRIEAIKCLIAHGARLDISKSGSTALHGAAYRNKLDVVKFYLREISKDKWDEARLSPHTRNDRGKTALHDAAEKGNNEICQTLLEFGLDVDEKDNDGRTPLDWAIKNNRRDAAHVLKAWKSDKENTEVQGRTLQEAAREDHRQALAGVAGHKEKLELYGNAYLDPITFR